MKYPKAFELYWMRARFHVRGLLMGNYATTIGPYKIMTESEKELKEEQDIQIKRLGFKCWKAGRRHIKV